MAERYHYTIFKKEQGEGKPIIIDLITGSEAKKYERLKQLKKWGYVAISLERKSNISNTEEYGTNIQIISDRLKQAEQSLKL